MERTLSSIVGEISPMITKRLRSEYAVKEVFQDWMIAVYQASNKQTNWRFKTITKNTDDEIWFFGSAVETSNLLFSLHTQESLSKLSKTGRQYFILHTADILASFISIAKYTF